MFIFWLIGLVLIGLIFWMLWRLRPDRSSLATPTDTDTALQKLRYRLASGEIDEATYQRIKRLIEAEEDAS